MAIANRTRKNRKRVFVATTGMITATAVIALVAAPGVAAVQNAPVSHVTAEGRYITGNTPLGSFDNLVKLHGAFSPGGSVPETVSNPLKVSLFNELNIDLGNKLQLFGDQGVIRLGALAQYAHTDPLGTQVAASGAISDQGAISIGGSKDAPSNAHLDLTGLLGNGLIAAITKPVIDEFTVDIGALSARAEATTGTDAKLSYQLGDLKSRVHSPAVEGLSSAVRSVFKAAGDGINSLFGGEGAISKGKDAILQVVQSALEIVPGQPLTLQNAHIATGVDIDLAHALDAILLNPIEDANKTISISLKDGSIDVDLAKLISIGTPGTSLNTLPPNTELLSADLIGKVLSGAVTEALQTFEKIFVDRLVDALNAVSTTVKVSGELYGLGGLVQLGSLDVDLGTKLGDVVSGKVKASDLKFKVGIIGGIQLPTDAIKNVLAPPFLAALAIPYKAVTGVLHGLNALINVPIQIAAGLLNPLTNILNKVVSLRANVQQQPGHFTEGKAPTDGSATVTALSLALLPNLTGKSALAQVDLAAATVRVGKLAPPVITTPKDGDKLTVADSGSTVGVKVTGTGLNGAEVIGKITSGTGKATDFTTTVKADGTWDAGVIPEGVGEYTITALQKTPHVSSENATSKFSVGVKESGGNGGGTPGTGGGGTTPGGKPAGPGDASGGKTATGGNTQTGGLAGTGADMLPFLGVGALLLLAGTGAYLLRRRSLSGDAPSGMIGDIE